MQVIFGGQMDTPPHYCKRGCYLQDVKSGRSRTKCSRLRATELGVTLSLRTKQGNGRRDNAVVLVRQVAGTAIGTDHRFTGAH